MMGLGHDLVDLNRFPETSTGEQTYEVAFTPPNTETRLEVQVWCYVPSGSFDHGLPDFEVSDIKLVEENCGTDTGNGGDNGGGNGGETPGTPACTNPNLFPDPSLEDGAYIKSQDQNEEWLWNIFPNINPYRIGGSDVVPLSTRDEASQEHSRTGGAYLYDSLCHVPLFFRANDY